MFNLIMVLQAWRLLQCVFENGDSTTPPEFVCSSMGNQWSSLLHASLQLLSTGFSYNSPPREWLCTFRVALVMCSAYVFIKGCRHALFMCYKTNQ